MCELLGLKQAFCLILHTLVAHAPGLQASSEVVKRLKIQTQAQSPAPASGFSISTGLDLPILVLVSSFIRITFLGP